MSGFSAIGLQNDLHFKLRAPKKGKIKRSPNYTAYNKTALSSIPRNVEVILLKDSNINQTSSFIKQHSQSSIFKHIPINNKETSNTLLSNGIIPDYISNKGYGNGFASDRKRFDGYNEFKAKYSPGPGEYNNQPKDSHSKERYKSLFSKNSGYKNLFKEDCPGPGFYNPNNLFRSCENNIGSSFKSRNVRFKEPKKDNMGPGYYSKPSTMRWDSKIPSSFFKEYSHNYIHNPIEKYVNTGKIISEDQPGPGYYEIKREFNQIERPVEKHCDENNNLSSLIYCVNNDNNKLIPDELREFNNLIKEEQMYRNYSYNNYQFINKFDPFNLRKSTWKKEIRSPFLSKTKKCTLYDKAANHNPGPCYYQQTNSFHNEMFRRNKRNKKR